MKQILIDLERKVVGCVADTRIPHHVLGGKFQPRFNRPEFQETPGERVKMASGTIVNRNASRTDTR